MIKFFSSMSLAAKSLLINAAVSVLIVVLFGSLSLSHLHEKKQDIEHQILQLSASLTNEFQRRHAALDNHIALLSRNESLMDRLLEAEMENNASTLPLPEKLLGQLDHDLFRLFGPGGAVVARHGGSADVIPAEFRDRPLSGFLQTDEGLLFVVQAPVINSKQVMGYVALADSLDANALSALLEGYEHSAAIQVSLNRRVLLSSDDSMNFDTVRQIKLGNDVSGQDVNFAVGLDRQAIPGADSQFFVYLALALLFVMLAWWFLYRRLIGDIVIRLSRTQAQLEKLQIGDVYPAPGHVADAIDMVDRSLHSMSRRLQMKAEKLQLERQTLLTITNAAPIWIWKTDASGSLVFVNKHMRDMLHLNNPEGCFLHELLNLEAGGQSAELPDLNTDCEAVCKIRVDDKLHDMHLITVRQVSSKGALVGMIGLAVDMTELYKLEASYRQAQKMEVLGTLVGGVAHNFNNMLASMVGHIFLAKNKTVGQPAVIQHLDKLEGTTAHAADMVKQLLAFVHKGMDIKELVELNSLIQEAFAMVSSGMPTGIHVSSELSDVSMTVYANASALQQVVVNLVVNARDALNDSVLNKTIVVRLQKSEVEAEMRQAHPTLQADAVACLTVQDNGCGIAAEDLEHIFEPFFTTKEIGKGTGLGLSMSIGTVESLGGWIEVDSEPGKGTVFRIYLPLPIDDGGLIENQPACI